jgi:[CysO sulfur-carrier protein]-S-L-cysteine hydrolase
MTNEAAPWVSGRLRLPRSVVNLLAEEATAAYGRGEEACGYVTGPATDPLLADRAVPMPNLANKYHRLDPEAYPRQGNTYFLLDSRKFQLAIEAGRGDGHPVKILWHSHLDVGAYFSETDAAAANMGGSEPANPLAYLVTSVRSGVVDDHKLFVWDAAAAGFVESDLTIVDDVVS